MGYLKRRAVCAILAVVMSVPLIGSPITANADEPKMQNQAICAGSEDMAVIKSDGSLWTWGANNNGLLGNGTEVPSGFPVKVMDNVKAVSGDSHRAVIKTDGSLWTWGFNGSGQLGDGTNVDRSKPAKVMDDVVSVSTESEFTAVIKTDRSLWVWGSNNYGQLANGKADGSPEAGLKPVKVMDNVTAVSVGLDHVAAVKTDGSLWTWGQNWAGQLGDGTTARSYVPKKVMNGVAAVTTSFGNTFAIKKDGSLWAWGSNRSGELGDGTTANSLAPKKIMENVTAVSADTTFTAAIKADGSLWTWGKNENGQLCDGTRDDRYTPVKVLEDVAAVSIRNCSTLAAKTDGSLWICGYNWTNPFTIVPLKILEDVRIADASEQKPLPCQVKDNIKVLYNNKQIAVGQPSVIKDGQLLVPAKEVFECMGTTVKWNGAEQSITATKGDVSVIMQVGYSIVSRNGIQSFLEASPLNINGKVYVPAKAAADAFSAAYDWNESSQTASIGTLGTSPLDKYAKYQEKMKVYGFDQLYNNKRADTVEPVTKAEALKLALGAVYNTNDISSFAPQYNEYEIASWIEYAKASGITEEDINSSNYDDKAKYSEVLGYFKKCKEKFLPDCPEMTVGTAANGNENMFKGQLNELVVNFAEKYNTIIPKGEVMITDPAKMPSNADKYPYILASVDKSIYEKPFLGNLESPKELYAAFKSDYPQIKTWSEAYFDGILNIDYRTITKESFKEKIAPYMIYEPSDVEVDYYIKYAKTNEIVIEGSAQLQNPIIYKADHGDWRARMRLKFEIKHSKTSKNLLYLDMLEASSSVYEKNKYDMLVDCQLSAALGSTFLYLDQNHFSKTIIDKESCGIIQEDQE